MSKLWSRGKTSVKLLLKVCLNVEERMWNKLCLNALLLVLKSIVDHFFAFLRHRFIVCNCIFIMKLACPATVFTIVSFIAVLVPAALPFFFFLERQNPISARGGRGGDAALRRPLGTRRQSPGGKCGAVAV